MSSRMNNYSKHPSHYTQEEVNVWLNSIGLDHAICNFEDNAVDGAMLMTLTEDDLTRDLGLTPTQAQKFFSSLQFAQSLAGAEGNANVSQYTGGSLLTNEERIKMLEAENATLIQEIADLNEIVNLLNNDVAQRSLRAAQQQQYGGATQTTPTMAASDPYYVPTIDSTVADSYSAASWYDAPVVTGSNSYAGANNITPPTSSTSAYVASYAPEQRSGSAYTPSSSTHNDQTATTTTSPPSRQNAPCHEVTGAPVITGAAGGAVKGALLGAIGGAIAGDPGQGAKIGAAIGGTAGGMQGLGARRRQRLGQQNYY